MKCIKATTTLYLIFILLGTLLIGQPVLAAAGNSSDYSWAEKFGYIQWADGTNFEGALVGASDLTNYLWSEKTGYISLNCSNTSSCGTVDYSVSNDGSGNLTGYAWSEKLGWINFDDISANNYYQVTIDINGNFSGYAWSEKGGYINMDDSGSLYKVTTTWTWATIATVVTETASDITNTSVAANGNITNTGGFDATTRGFKYALTATSTCDTWDVNEGGTFSTGAYSLPITGLTKGTTYFYRAYAINSQGTGYGSCQSFNTTITATPIILKQNVILKERIRLK